ncbi:16S rRNA (adenine(1518)-N(6)/adenine(1519)-N(6))-dimethyltransferase RsmA [Patescibacteria group bacterium]
MPKLKKELGQNFLKGPEIPQKMVEYLDLQENDLVLEIGPGDGAVTNFLIEKDAEIIAVEIDEHFAETLSKKFLNIQVINENILEWLPQFKPEKEFKIIGSLPYYITSPILHETIRSGASNCVFLIQKEVARKIADKAPDASYLSTFVQTFYDVEYLETVDRSKFKPEPNVDSAIIRLKKRESNIEDIKKYEGFLHRGFSNPRKMLKKSLPIELLEKSEVDPNDRAQHISMEKWVELFKAQ